MRRLLVLVVIVGLAVPAFAITQKVKPSSLDKLSLSDPALHAGRRVAPLEQVSSRVPQAAAWLAYRQQLGKEGVVMLDLRTGEAALVRGTPEPWIPGSGNSLTMNDLDASLGRSVTSVDAGVLRDLAQRFIHTHADLLPVPIEELHFLEALAVNPDLWVVSFDHQRDGITVEGSRLTLVVSHGNLVMWGSDRLAGFGAQRVAPTVTQDTVRSVVETYAGWDTARDTWLGVPAAKLLLEALPVSIEQGPLGSGAGHRLVYEVAFKRQGVTGTWMARVDGLTGDLLEFGDINAYGGVRGGVEPKTWTDPEQLWPLPLAHLSTGGYTSLEGLFTDPGGSFSGDLHGQLTAIEDQCGTAGTPVVDADVDGNINFGTGPDNQNGDANCTTNGVGQNGGEHNTHAARSAYYHITWIKAKGHEWLPTNSWLSSSHDVRVNISDVCNAYWQPSGGYNGFFQEGWYSTLHCYNTGEIAGVFLHEVGHGLDQNDNTGTADGGTGEAYADTHAMLQLHESCIGPGFWTQQCTGYGLPCVDCTGVRDSDYAMHEDGSGNPVTEPFTPANFTGPHCPTGWSSGPCGKEVHCEAYPGSGAIWDLAARKLPTITDQATAWYIIERDWYLGMQIATAMYNCDSSTYASDGCAATSWYQALLAGDDDDGDLTNGTPHAAQIFAAFDDHAIACGAASDAANQSSSSCPSLSATTVTATPQTDSIQLSWDAVTDATEYVVMKNHGECGEGYVQAAVVTAPTTTWEDTDVARYMSYSYRIVARTDNEACYSAMSNCVQTSIIDCPASIASAPGLTTPADNQVQVAFDDSGSCSGFNIYRRQGGCADSGFTLIAGAEPSSPVVDSTVSGGVTYGYRLTALDPDGQLESGPSPCAEITATGVCNEQPTFGGLLSATNSHIGACGIDLTWTAGSTICTGQSVVYNVYRDTSSGFTPGDGNRVASGVVGPSWHDDGVVYGTTYYYIVRAEALTGVGPGPNGGVEDLNLQEASAAPSGPDTDLFFDDMESGTTSWTPAVGPNDGGSTDPWGQVTDEFHSTTTSWFVLDQPSVKDQLLNMSGPAAVPAGAPAVLEFWHDFYTESGYDGGVLEYSTDGGTTWQDILEGDGGSVPANANRFLSGGYNDTLSTGYSNPLPGRDAWSGDSSGWQLVQIDVSEMSGLSVLFRWRFGCDSSVNRDGWWLDDVRVFYGSACGGCAVPPTFAGIGSLTDHGTPQAALDLSWAAATDNCGSGSMSYRVYHGPDAGSVDFGTPVFETPDLAATMMGMTMGQHCFAVRADDGLGNEDGNVAVLCATPGSEQVGSGDADCNGVIDHPDVPAILGVIFGSLTDCGSGFYAADVNASGAVDAGDLNSEITYLTDPM